MKTPDLTHKEFHFLSPLVAGEPWRLATLVNELRWQRKEAGVSRTLSQLTEKGLVQRVRWKGRRLHSRHPLRPIGYQITAAGKRAWAESAEFYLFLTKQYGKRSKKAPRDRGLTESLIEPAPFVSKCDGPDRRMTDAEWQSLLKACAAEPWFAQIFRAMRASCLRLETLVALEVGDVDLMQGVVRVANGRQVPVNFELRDVLAEAIGDCRQSDRPVFFNQSDCCLTRKNRGRFTFQRVLKGFLRFRELAGIDPRAKLRGRTTNGRRNVLGAPIA
jgi:hypothetical protein